ncbi:MAG: CopG family transcriptional regulator [Clostridiales bacterium]|nr:CopG family transcriptional regulator [Clostridiales bacterium]
MRIAVIGIVIEKDRSASKAVNEVLSNFGEYIVGRMGIPDNPHEVYVISVIMRATTEIISSMTGKLGRINNVTVKSAVTNVEI